MKAITADLICLFSKAAELFSSKEEELEFLEDHDLDIARAEVLESLGRQAEAAELYLAEGRTLDAIHLFLKDDNDQNSLRRGRQCILEGLWQNLSFGTEVDSVPKTSSFQQLLVMAEQLHPSQLDSAQIDEVCLMISRPSSFQLKVCVRIDSDVAGSLERGHLSAPPDGREVL